MNSEHFLDIANHLLAWRGRPEFVLKISEALELVYKQGVKDSRDEDGMSTQAQITRFDGGHAL